MEKKEKSWCTSERAREWEGRTEGGRGRKEGLADAPSKKRDEKMTVGRAGGRTGGGLG